MLSREKLKMRGEIEALSKQPRLGSVLLRYGTMAVGKMHLVTRGGLDSPVVETPKRIGLRGKAENIYLKTT